MKVGITELQERLELPVQIGISIQQVAQQRREVTKRFFEVFWQEEEEVYVASWARWDARWKGLVEKMSRRKSGNINAEQKTRNIPKCDRR